MLCCGYLQIAVCFQILAGQYPSEFYVACCALGVCKKLLLVSGLSVPIQSLCCMLCCEFLQMAVCFQLVNTHLNSMLHVVSWVSARNSCLFLAGQYTSEFYVACCVLGICKQLFASRLQPVNTHPNSMLQVVLCVFARNWCLFLAGQYPSEFYVACCVGGICKQLFVSSRLMPIKRLCCMLRCGCLQEIDVGIKPVNTHLNSMLHVVLRVFVRNIRVLLASQNASECYVAWCAVGICKQLFVSSWSILIRMLCCMLCCGYLKQLFVSSRSIPIRILCCMLCCGYLQIAVCFQPVKTHPNSMLHVVLWGNVRNICLSLACQYPFEFHVACCVVGACKQLFVSRRSIPIRILCCMLCCGYLQKAVCFQPVNTHPNSMLHVVLWAMLHVVLWVFANSCLFLAGQYPSEVYVACCAVGICKQLFVSSWSIPIRILCSWSIVGICKKQLFVSSRSIPIRILCCMSCCGHLQIAVCFQPANTHPNSMLHVVLWVFARNCCWFQSCQYRSQFYVACCVVGYVACCVGVFANSCLFLAVQFPSEFYVACCVVGICKKQLFVSSRSIHMLCCGFLSGISVCFQPVNTHPNSMLHVVLRVFAGNSCLFLAGQYPSEFYVACCVVGICKKSLFASSRSIPVWILCCMLCCGYLQIAVCFQPVKTHPNSMLHVVLWGNVRNICLSLACQYPFEFHVACCVVGICKETDDIF